MPRKAHGKSKSEGYSSTACFLMGIGITGSKEYLIEAEGEGCAVNWTRGKLTGINRGVVQGYKLADPLAPWLPRELFICNAILTGRTGGGRVNTDTDSSIPEPKTHKK
ncbi:MAG: hypothetical protein ACOX6S_11535 [Clostridia bacterium]